MAGYRKRNTEGPNSEDKALDLFAEMMIEKSKASRKIGTSRGLPRVYCNGRVTCRARVQRYERPDAAPAL